MTCCLALIGACAGDGDAAQPPFACASGDCTPRHLSAIPLALEATPPGSIRGWVAQEYLDPAPEADGTFLLRVPTAAVLKGRVVSSDDLAAVLPARVIASRASLIPGRSPLQFGAETAVSGWSSDQNSGEAASAPSSDGYVLWLDQGYTYSLQAEPKSPLDVTLTCASDDCAPSFPPSTVSDLLVDQDTERDIVLDGPDRSVDLRGQVRDAAGQPLPFSVQVRAFSSSGGRSSIGYTCSTAQPELCDCGTGGSCLGAFRLRALRARQAYVVRVKPIAASITSDANGLIPMIPTVECSEILLGTDDEPTDSLEPTYLPEAIRLPAFPLAQQYELSVVGEHDEPITGAQVTFSIVELENPRAPQGFDECHASYKRVAITDGDGKATLVLFPGDTANRVYSVTVLSPASSEYASQRIARYEIGPRGGALASVRLQRRYTVSGTVLDFEGNPVEDAVIEAQGIPASEDPADAGTIPATVSSISGDRGAFTLSVDPGAYNVQIRPPASAGVPSFGVNARRFEAAASDVVFQAPPPATLIGRILDPGGESGEGFTIRAFDVAPTAEVGTSVSAVIRTTTISDPDGWFQIVLPGQ